MRSNLRCDRHREEINVVKINIKDKIPPFFDYEAESFAYFIQFI